MAEMTPEQSPLDGDEWQRITQMHEVVKQEGDGRCEQIRAHNVLLAALRATRERAERAEKLLADERAELRRQVEQFARGLRRYGPVSLAPEEG